MLFIFMIVVATVIASVALKTPAKPQEIAETAIPSRCQMDVLLGESIQDIRKFSAGEWSFLATGEALEIGQFASINGEARCNETSLIVDVLAIRQSDSWRIKKMAPIKDRDH